MSPTLQDVSAGEEAPGCVLAPCLVAGSLPVLMVSPDHSQRTAFPENELYSDPLKLLCLPIFRLPRWMSCAAGLSLRPILDTTGGLVVGFQGLTFWLKEMCLPFPFSF